MGKKGFHCLSGLSTQKALEAWEGPPPQFIRINFLLSISFLQPSFDWTLCVEKNPSLFFLHSAVRFDETKILFFVLGIVKRRCSTSTALNYFSNRLCKWMRLLVTIFESSKPVETCWQLGIQRKKNLIALRRRTIDDDQGKMKLSNNPETLFWQWIWYIWEK